MERFDYTISSTDFKENSVIRTNLSCMQTEFCRMTITSLTTMANIVVLSKDDYFVLNGVKYCINDDYTEISASSLTESLNLLLQSVYGVDNVQFMYDQCDRIYITSDEPVNLTECSYNLKLLFGLVNVTLPLQSIQIDTNTYKLLFPDVGMFLSTPVLYLASNLGSNSYKNIQKNTTSMRILMRITNSFFAKQPITTSNGDYTTTVRSSDLSDVHFILMDANYHVLKLLSPMYLTVEIEAIPDKLDYEKDFSQGPINPAEFISMNQFAYLRDLTERGEDVAEDEIETKIFIEPPQQQQEQAQNTLNSH